MKVFIVTYAGFPYGMAATSRIKCYAQAIVEGGVDCEVIVYRRTEIYGQKIKNTEIKGVYKNVPYRYTTKNTFRSRNRLISHYMDKWDLRTAKHYIRDNIKKGDVLFLYLGMPVEIAMQLMEIAHANAAYCIRDLCELPYGTDTETEQSIRLRKKTLKTQFPKLDGIVSISDALLNLARSYTRPTCKHIKVPIMVDFNQFYLPEKSVEAKIPYIFHAGSLSDQKDGFTGMVEAFGRALNVINKPVKFISTGFLDNLPNKENIKQLISDYHLENKLHFVGFLSEDELKDYLSKASLVIINKYRTQQNNYCFSTKLGEYLAAAKPVIITNVGEAMNWLKNDESAFVVDSEDVGKLSDAIVKVFAYPEKSRCVGLAGQDVCRKNFDYHNWSKPLVDFMNQLGE